MTHLVTDRLPSPFRGNHNRDSGLLHPSTKLRVHLDVPRRNGREATGHLLPSRSTVRCVLTILPTVRKRVPPLRKHKLYNNGRRLVLSVPRGKTRAITNGKGRRLLTDDRTHLSRQRRHLGVRSNGHITIQLVRPTAIPLSADRKEYPRPREPTPQSPRVQPTGPLPDPLP